MKKKELENKPIKTKKLLLYKFTEDEIKDLGKQLAMRTKELEQLKLDKKAVVSEFDNKIKNSEAGISLSSGQISAGSEYRQIECEVILNEPKNGKKTITRLDTAESWEEMMTLEEMQERIFKEEDE